MLGGVALLLWGLRMVNTGVTRAFGRELGKILNLSLRNRVNSFFGGLGVTMLLQSSTATALLTASFAGRGLVPAAAGIAIMLGADVGTTLVAQLLSFDLSWLAPVMLFVGFVRHSSAKSTRAKNLGRILLGLGMMLTALKLLVMASEPVRQSDVAQYVFSSLANEPVLTVVLGALVAFIAHSSLATVLFIVTLASTGGVPLDVGYAMILGANLGGALPPVLATMNGDAASRRPPLGNFICRLAGVIVLLPFLDLVAMELVRLESEPARQLVNLHTFFNLGLAAFFIFWTGPLGRLTEKLIPETRNANASTPVPMHLDKAALASPQLALANSVRDTLRMGDVLEQMFRDFRQAFENNDKAQLEPVRKSDEYLKNFSAAIKQYLTELGRETLEEEDEERCTEIISFSSDLEQIGNIVVLNLAEYLERTNEQQIVFSDADMKDQNRLFDMLVENLKLSFSVLLTRDMTTAGVLVRKKQALRDEVYKAANDHLERLRFDQSFAQDASALHLGLLSDLRRISSLISSIAYSVRLDAERLAAGKGTAKPASTDEATTLDPSGNL
ncbi:Na/Pi cotransporter family protein [Sneathiella chinensis]|uniref:Na/Pi cotransporter family protein n=1 Tax=Sneathiella chinensis TaxID=349750 RepID=UPI0023F9FE64|nr:Na/Pi cotransporter family protein [Sneathiella chinensis]